MPLPMLLGEIYAKLLSIGHMTPHLFPSLKPPFPNWYKPDLTCEYHAGNPSHNIDTYSTFKRKFLQLFKVGWITFEDTLNINSNLLPNHTFSSGGVNVVEFERKEDKVLRVTMDRLYDILEQPEYFPIKNWIKLKKEWQFL